MKLHRLSTRTKALQAVYGVVLAISVGFMLALLVSLGGYYIAGWEDAPVSETAGQFVAWGLYAILPAIALRFAVIWSANKDRDAQ